MSDINFPRDDEGRTRLQISNRKKKPGSVQETGRVEPYPTITRARTPTHARAPFREEPRPENRRRQERRKQQRRKRNTPVLLDTRDRHDRRTRRRRADDPPPDHGIDSKA
ncbi:MAG TPA: hypothetical protein ENJ22_02690 [Gammaproteobacteria bacterium]|nr:hypothetical protein [Gammaproteobacteria bacterium]